MTSPDRRAFTADELEQMFHGALKAGDVRGMGAALTVMAGVDPHRAQRLYDDTRAALAIARGDAVEVVVRAVDPGGDML